MSNKPLKHIAKESLFVILSLVCMFAVIVITSIAEAGLDPTKIFSKDNLSNILINASITIFGTLASIPAGMVATKQRINPDGSLGRYMQEFNDYYKIRQKIEPRRKEFGQWHHGMYLKEQYSKREKYLLNQNIDQAPEVLKLSREQILELTTSKTFIIDGKEQYFKALSPNQIKACLKVYDGKVTVHKLPDFYFLYVDGKSKKSFYDQAYYEARDENSIFISKLLYKMTLGFIITSIFTGIIIEYNTGDPSVSQTSRILKMLLTIVSRIFNAISSTMWGYLIGQEVVYAQCYYINGKTQFLEEFNADTEFTYISDSKILEQEYTNISERSIPDGQPERNKCNDTDTIGTS